MSAPRNAKAGQSPASLHERATSGSFREQREPLAAVDELHAVALVHRGWLLYVKLRMLPASILIATAQYVVFFGSSRPGCRRKRRTAGAGDRRDRVAAAAADLVARARRPRTPPATIPTPRRLALLLDEADRLHDAAVVAWHLVCAPAASATQQSQRATSIATPCIERARQS